MSTQHFFTSRKNNTDGQSYIGESGRLWYDPDTNTIRVSDGSTPGGLIVGFGKAGFAPITFESLTWANIANKPNIPVVPSNVSAFNNDSNYANTQYVQNAISNLVNSAPSVLDTLGEIANALGNNPNFSNSVLDILSHKANIEALANVAFTGSYTNLINTPNLSVYQTVANSFSGDYNNLSNRPFIPIDVSNLTDTTHLLGPYDRIVSGNYATVISNTGVTTVPGNILPTQDNTFNLGSPTMRFKEIHVGPGTVYIGNIRLSDGGNGYLSASTVTNPGKPNEQYVSNALFQPTYSTVATTGSYTDLINKPSLSNVALTGNYNDLSNRPSLSNVALTGNYSSLTNTPNLSIYLTIANAFSGNYNDLTNKPNLANVAFTGSYTSLSNRPNLAVIATTGSYTDLINKPSLSNVALTGNYNDLSNRPTIPTKLTDLGITDGSNGQFLTTNGNGTFSFITNVVAGNITASGNISANGNVVASGNLNVFGLTLNGAIEQSIIYVTGATGTVTYDFNIGSVFYHSGATSNWTANIINVGLVQSRMTTVNMYIVQSQSSWLPTVFKIDGTTVTVLWNTGNQGNGHPNKTDTIILYIFNINGTYKVYGFNTVYG